jgi:diacylglycerol kinase family enzyme
MTFPRDERPTLAVIPMGSGNDFARTIGMTPCDPDAAIAQLLSGAARPLDLAHVRSDAGESAHVIETLSFGLDAAIALDTTDRRAADTSQEGSGLFVTSGLKLIARGAEGYPARLCIDGEKPLELTTLVLAVQLGPTYGGGFRICPDAVPNDGLLDLCYNVKTPSLPHLLALFGLARAGRHVRSSVVELRRARRLTVDFAREPPCQVDGERLRGTAFEVDVVPGALDVIVPKQVRW